MRKFASLSYFGLAKLFRKSMFPITKRIHPRNKLMGHIINLGTSLSMGIVLPRYYGHVYIFVFVNIEIKTLELFTLNGWLHTLRL